MEISYSYMETRGALWVVPITHEGAEFIQVRPVPAARALALARNGELKDGRSALALLLCESYLRKLG